MRVYTQTADTSNAGESEAIDGQYANYFEIGYNAFEFLLDFGQFDFRADRSRMHTRIVTSPAYARALSELLAASLKEYEAKHGELPGDK
jgi:hypothetical protein